jgi:hypothetical protein
MKGIGEGLDMLFIIAGVGAAVVGGLVGWGMFSLIMWLMA